MLPCSLPNRKLCAGRLCRVHGVPRQHQHDGYRDDRRERLSLQAWLRRRELQRVHRVRGRLVQAHARLRVVHGLSDFHQYSGHGDYRPVAVPLRSWLHRPRWRALPGCVPHYKVLQKNTGPHADVPCSPLVRGPWPACNLGTYQPVRGGSTCLTCPEDSTTVTLAAAELAQCLCLPGYTNSSGTGCEGLLHA